MQNDSNGSPPGGSGEPVKKRRAPRSRTPKDPISQAESLENMPSMEVSDPSAEQGNGHAVYPSGANEVYGIDDMDRGKNEVVPSREFMTAHTDDMQRLLAESVLKPEDVDLIVLLEADAQSTWGFVSDTCLAKIRLAGSIGIDGRGREDGVKVETMGMRSMMARGKGWLGKMFGIGGGGGEQPPGPGMEQG